MLSPIGLGIFPDSGIMFVGSVGGIEAGPRCRGFSGLGGWVECVVLREIAPGIGVGRGVVRGVVGGDDDGSLGAEG